MWEDLRRRCRAAARFRDGGPVFFRALEGGGIAERSAAACFSFRVSAKACSKPYRR